MNLVNAWAQLSKRDAKIADDWCLIIAGRDQGGHEALLKQILTQFDIQHSVIFVGALSESQKEAAYQHCDAFILPSFSEGLPMVVLEAWAYGKPVLMTRECNLPEGFTANAAIGIEPNVESITQGLAQLRHAPESTLHALGNNGRALVAARFVWPKVAADMRSVYAWVLGGGPKPEFVTEGFDER